jgi:hypothetical protein
MDRNDLLGKLQDLRSAASESHRLNEIGRTHLYLTLSRIYFTHREFMQSDPMYLDELYAAAGIGTAGEPSNEINYRPFLRLVWDQVEVSGSMNNRLTHWNSVLRQLDARYLENPDYFGEIGREHRLASYIEERGGITQMVFGHVRLDPGMEEVPKPSPSEARKIVEQKLTTEAVAAKHLELLAVSSAPALATVTFAETVRSDEERFVAMLGRAEPDGSVKVLGSTNEPTAIKAVAAHALKKDYRHVSPVLRLIGEIVGTQIYPLSGKPANADKHKEWLTGVYLDPVSKHKGPRTGKRRLLLRGNEGDILFSGVGCDLSVVVICKPTLKLGVMNSVYLKPSVCNIVEDAICTGSFELMRSKPSDRLKTVSGKPHSHELAIQDHALGKVRKLQFYPIGHKQAETEEGWQTNFDVGSFQPEWKAEVDAGWFTKLCAEHLDEWFSTLGRDKQIKRKNNQLFEVSVSREQFIIRYNIDATGNAPTHTMSVNVSFEDEAAGWKCLIRSKDLAPVLFNLVDIPLLGMAEISGNAEAVVLKYKTTLGEYVIAVPTVGQATDAPTTLFGKEV